MLDWECPHSCLRGKLICWRAWMTMTARDGGQRRRSDTQTWRRQEMTRRGTRAHWQNYRWNMKCDNVEDIKLDAERGKNGRVNWETRNKRPKKKYPLDMLETLHGVSDKMGSEVKRFTKGLYKTSPPLCVRLCILCSFVVFSGSQLHLHAVSQ